MSITTITEIDNINIRYTKEKHIRNHFDVAVQFRSWLEGKTGLRQSFLIWNEGKDREYTYIVQNENGAWRLHTKMVWIDPEYNIFKNVITLIEDLIDRTSSGTRRYFS